MLKRSIFIAGLTIGSLSLASQGAYALSWNWAYTDNQGGQAQGTFTTDGTSYNSTDVYTISAITGTYKPNGGLAQTITGLSNYTGLANQQIMWDGTVASPILVDFGGFEFETNTAYFSNPYYNNQVGYGPVNSYSEQSGTGGNTGSITSSSLTPVPFEFSPEQGFILGIPLFLGLRKLKKNRA